MEVSAAVNISNAGIGRNRSPHVIIVNKNESWYVGDENDVDVLIRHLEVAKDMLRILKQMKKNIDEKD